MELLINGLRADLKGDKISLPPCPTPAIADLQAARVGRSLTLDLPATPTNDHLFGFGRDPESADRFNAVLNRAELCHEGATLMRGVVTLVQASLVEGYRILIREGAIDWVETIARKPLRALGIDYQETISPLTIAQSWESDAPVKFFPLHRDCYAEQNSTTDLMPTERLLTVDDYYPFLALRPMVEQIFADAGYRLESEFFQSPLFRSLHLSGAYAEADTSALRNRMGFLARRLTSVTADADYFGRVYADPASSINTVGNLVETATPYQLDEDGEAVQGLYANGNCFGVEDGRILFRPLSTVDVAFEYYLKYTTDHVIYTRDKLIGFDAFYGGTGSVMQFGLTNRYEDRRNTLAVNRKYLVVVFDHAADSRYRLTYTVDGVDGVELGQFENRSGYVTTAAASSVASPQLSIANSDGQWEPYTGDWALYDGHLTERGQTIVSLSLTTPVETISPTSPKYFDRIFFDGATLGMSITLSKECTIRPIFRSTPSYGSTVCFEDVARHSVQQLEFLEAVAHLFNLRFMTDTEQRVVRVEPYVDLVATDEVVDWRERVLLDEAVRLSDGARELAEEMTLSYASGDGVVTRFDNEHDTKLGRWSFAVDSYSALQGERISYNPLFHPSLSSIDHYANAPSAQLLEVGNRELDDPEALPPITPRLVSYRGMVALPEGERWGYPLFEGRYPLILFHQSLAEAVDPFTLCFEDRDGATGLHRYWQPAWEHLVEGGYIDLTVRLDPIEWEMLHTAEGQQQLLATFLLQSPEGACRGRLVELGPYEPTTHRLRCTFQRLV